jgi:hypothetical protein
VAIEHRLLFTALQAKNVLELQLEAAQQHGKGRRTLGPWAFMPSELEQITADCNETSTITKVTSDWMTIFGN